MPELLRGGPPVACIIAYGFCASAGGKLGEAQWPVPIFDEKSGLKVTNLGFDKETMYG